MRGIRTLLPEPIKKVIRFFRYANERRKVVRELAVRRQQNKLIGDQYDRQGEMLVVFVVPGANWFTGEDVVTGGILSIASIYEETRKLEQEHGFQTLMVTGKDECLLLKHTKFPNDITVFRFDQIFRYFTALKHLVIHIPDFMVIRMNTHLRLEAAFLHRIENLHLNILNQNIRLMPEPQAVRALQEITPHVTQTTAHEQYSTQEMRDKYGIPLHRLSVFGSPERYARRPFGEKENLIVLSPDFKPWRNEVIETIKKELPQFRFVVIEDMPYLTYLKNIGLAKFTITFGEGLDFYFIETIFSGGLGISLYNDEFFMDQFAALPGVFLSVDALRAGIVNFIREMDHPASFAATNEQQFRAVATIYKYDEYVANIRKFYKADYTFK